MEDSVEDLQIKSQDDADAKTKDSVILNGLNGGYDVDNGDAKPSSDNVESKNLDKCEKSSDKNINIKDSAADMEVDSNDEVESGTKPVTDVTSAGVDSKSDEVVSGISKECEESEMDVDAQSNASDDVECIGEDDKKDEDGDDGEEDEDEDDQPKDDEEDGDEEEEEEDDEAQQLDQSIEILDSSQQKENGSVGSPDVEEITDGDEEGPLVIDNSSDVEEIKPEDPLAEVDNKDKENSKHKSSSIKSITTNNKNMIVVNDTKRLVEIAAGTASKNTKGGKKEPTLVIIDTNSILSGKGGVPVTSNQKSSHHSSSSLHGMSSSSSSSFSMMPIPMGTQQIFNTRTTITPVPMKSTQLNSSKSTTITPVLNPAHIHQQQQQQLQQQQLQQQLQQQQQLPQILPTLTDDMFVVEAPSFIVPYVYEKPPLKPMKNFIDKLQKGIKDFDAEEKARKQADKEKRKAEGKEIEDDDDDSDEDEKKDDTPKEKSEFSAPAEDKNKIPTYFDMPLGKFFMTIGMNLVQEFVQTDLLRTTKRKHSKGGASAETQMAINSLIKNLEFSKENNEPFHLDLKKCEFCNFKTESAIAMQHHLETPHMRNYVYKCNFCPVEVRSPHDILFHMEAEHNTRGRLERGPAFHQCPNCPFEDNQKGKLTRHILACQKKFRPERNLEPALDWEPPAKIPRLNRVRNMGPTPSSVAMAMAMNLKANPQAPLLPKLLPAPGTTGRGRGRPPVHPRYPDMKSMRPGGSPGMRQDNIASMMYRPTSSGLMMPNNYPFNSSQIFQNTSVTNASSVKNPTAKLLSQPSISITPLPRTTAQPSKPGSGSGSKMGGKSTFVICEICDGYIKDLEQLRNHMQWIHKVKIHPKMIYNRPPLNCQKCQFRFFTDQGLERHLLGSHGLVTSSMQEAANKGNDAGRCPACGRVFQWKLLNHVARDHGMTLKPAHLSYKCTVCTATFGMYKQFENHVYSAHSVVAKRVMDKKSSAPSSPSSRSNDSLLKPLKINDEITIIPQPAKPTNRPQARNK